MMNTAPPPRPNAQRLSRLTDLRRARRLSLSDMAVACGMTGSQSRQTAGDWERGVYRPDEEGRRAPFMRYLWETLDLRARPDEFQSVWTMLVEEWGWAPLTEQELATLGLLPEQASVHEAVAPPVPVAVPASTVAADQADGVARRAYPLGRVATWIGVSVLLILLVWAALVWQSPRPSVMTLRNMSFEDAQSLTPWAVVGDDECAMVVNDPDYAHHGAQFVRLHNGRAGCTSLRHDLALEAEPGATVRFAIRARSTVATVQPVELVLWGGRGAQRVGFWNARFGGDDQSLPIKAAASFVVDGHDWHCLEVALTVPAGGVERLRAEIYLAGDSEAWLDIDDAGVNQASASLCNDAFPRIVDGGFEQSQAQLAWQVTPRDCPMEVVNDPAGAHEGDAYLAVVRGANGCQNLVYELPVQPVQGMAYRARVWVRVAQEKQARVTLALHGVNDSGEAPITSKRPFVVHPGEWRCTEALLDLKGGRYDRLRVELYLETPDVEYRLDDVVLGAGVTPLCPPHEILINPSFEDTTRFTPWATLDECPLTIEADGTAVDGAHVARIEKQGRCFSLYQDVQETYADVAVRSFSLWMRTEPNRRARGRLALWYASSSPISKMTPFVLHGAVWTCQEVTLRVPRDGRPDAPQWRVEVYFESDDEVYYLDHGEFVVGAQGSCPRVQYEIAQAEVLAAAPLVPGSVVSGRVRIANRGQLDIAMPTQMNYWLAETRQGPPLHQDALGSLVIPPLAAGELSPPLYFDLNVPLGMAAAREYQIPLSFAPPPTDGATLGDVDAFLTITLLECAADALYCDVPTASWGADEAAALYAAGITTGCRSAAQPYHNLPFCGTQILWPSTLAVFIGRHEYGVAYQPTATYQGLFADIPVSHPRALWIEEFGMRFAGIARPGCPAANTGANFCPDAPVLRGELLGYLARIVGLTPGEDDASYADVTDPELARLATAAHAAGLMPLDDPACPAGEDGLPRFCPDEPVLRLQAGVWLARAYGLVDVAALTE